MASGSLIPQTFSGSFWSMFSDPSASQLPASLSGAFDGMKA
jgi:hypothetical protein